MAALQVAASPAQLLAGQDLIYGGRHSAAALYFSELATQYPADAAPRALHASALIWQGEAEGNETFAADVVDSLLTAAVELAARAVDTATADADRVQALFWLGTAYGYRARQAELRGGGSLWRASRDARAMHDALERALALDSSCADCLLPLGLYDYAVARSSTLARLIARIIGLGGGNAERGLDRVRRAGELGTFTRVEARWVYANMLLREEPGAGARREEARRTVADLAARFPENLVFRRFLEPTGAP
ncbi:MAG: hypothetical protein A2085_02605 [Gemmatimonadetes bacterium GWC2_71_10]|nr:MAG: hypothetical protein A2085_02605 [Gemmatimonadetes bacterium GWC2_71_10]